MVFLIDDNKPRQIGEFWWDAERFAENSEMITPIYDLLSLESLSGEIFRDGNTVLYHESFLDHTHLSFAASEKRRRLEAFAGNHKNFQLAIFSGSKNSRKISNINTASLPVSRLYQNLEFFIKKHSEGESDLRYLLFGSKPEVEEDLILKLNKCIARIDKQKEQVLTVEGSLSSNILFVQSYKNPVQSPILNAKLKKVIKIEDEDFSSFIKNRISVVKYDHIFLPISLGQTLSDFNGLRLATHLRCTPGPNQRSNILIYSFVGIDELMNNEYFDILKTKNVSLVPYDKATFAERASQSPASELTASELPKEVSKLNLKPPKNYQDSHSIKNEWAIHQWAHAISATDDKEVQRIIGNVEHNVYFKYLKTTSVSNSWKKLSDQELKIKSANDSKILLIDDETNKGWYKIFCALLADRNSIDFHDFGESFKGLNTDEVVRQSVVKILDENFDMVILDFRLHSDDFSDGNPDDITSIRILKEVKRKNPGVQVIVFSATSKAWNLQAIQNAGADGFVFKDGSGNVTRSIKNMISLVSDSLFRANCLKKVYSKLTKLEDLSKKLELRTSFDESIVSNKDIVFQLILKSFEEKKYLNYAYLQLFLIVEDFLREPGIFFKENGDYYVVSKEQSYLVLQRDEDFTVKEYSSAIKRVNKGHYVFGRGEIASHHITTDCKMSVVLLYRYGCNKSTEKNWIKIRDNRNKRAVHPKSKKNTIKQIDINELIDFLLFILNKENTSEPLEDFSFQALSPQDKMVAMMEKFNSNRM